MAPGPDFQIIAGVIVPTCHQCLATQLARKHDPKPEPRGVWWCAKCLDKRCDEIFDEHQSGLKKLLKIKKRFIEQTMSAPDGSFDLMCLSDLQKQEALHIQIKIARLAGIRDSYLLQANYGQYLDFQEPSISPTSKEAEFLIIQWRDSEEGAEIWGGYPHRTMVDHAYVAGINEGYLRQSHERMKLPGARCQRPKVVKGKHTGVKHRLAEVIDAESE